MELHGAGVHLLLTSPLGSPVLEPHLEKLKLIKGWCSEAWEHKSNDHSSKKNDIYIYILDFPGKT